MSGVLESVCNTEEFRGKRWLGSWIVGGSPLQDPACELLFKQGLPQFRKALFVNWGGGAFLSLLDSRHGQVEVAHCYCEDNELFLKNLDGFPSIQATGLAWVPGDRVPAEWRDVDLVLVRMWKEMDYNLVWLGALMDELQSSCAYHFIGPKDDGIRNLENRLAVFGCVETWAIGCHSRWICLAQANRPADYGFPPVVSGLFCGGTMDAGTRLLLENAGPMESLGVCDLGCGSGEIALHALKKGAKRVLAIDHQYLAVRYVQERIEGYAGRADAACHFIGDGVEERFDLVLTNPPFHLQGQLRMAIGQLWLKSAKQLIAPGGHIRLVCNEFLDYPRFAKDNGLNALELAHARGFRVFDFSM